MKNWTISQIPDLSGKITLVTEADNTLGYETAKTFAKNGAITILACRDLTMGERIKADILTLHPKASIEVMQLDLRDPQSIQQFGKEINQKIDRLDILLNIGDSHTIPAGDSAKYFGKHFASDHAGHFVLTSLLLNKLAATPHSRVVNLSLGEHKLKDKDFNKLIGPNGHSNSQKHKIGNLRWTNQVFTYELQKLFDSKKINCVAVSAYSGPSNKNLERRLKNSLSWKIFKPFFLMASGPDAQHSALPALKAATANNVKGGEYFGADGSVDTSGYQSYNAVLHFVA